MLQGGSRGAHPPASLWLGTAWCNSPSSIPVFGSVYCVFKSCPLRPWLCTARVALPLSLLPGSPAFGTSHGQSRWFFLFFPCQDMPRRVLRRLVSWHTAPLRSFWARSSSCLAAALLETSTTSVTSHVSYNTLHREVWSSLGRLGNTYMLELNPCAGGGRVIK